MLSQWNFNTESGRNVVSKDNCIPIVAYFLLGLKIKSNLSMNENTSNSATTYTVKEDKL